MAISSIALTASRSNASPDLMPTALSEPETLHGDKEMKIENALQKFYTLHGIDKEPRKLLQCKDLRLLKVGSEASQLVRLSSEVAGAIEQLASGWSVLESSKVLEPLYKQSRDSLPPLKDFIPAGHTETPKSLLSDKLIDMNTAYMILVTYINQQIREAKEDSTTKYKRRIAIPVSSHPVFSFLEKHEWVSKILMTLKKNGELFSVNSDGRCYFIQA
jgi:hypothetical protein